MHDIMRRQRVSRLDCLEGRLSHRSQAEDHTGRDGGFAIALRGCHRKGAEGQGFQFSGVFLEKARKIDAEIVQGKVGDGDAAA